jgi:serine/threonine protein kinase
MRELLHEAHIMTRLKHANLLRIIGVTFFGEKQQLSLVTDFMKNGSLLEYLRKNRKVFLESDVRVITMKLNSFARQIFEAMSYLEERKVIHRDLAARNCLIGEGDTLKVGDFGLTTYGKIIFIFRQMNTIVSIVD